MVDLKWWDFELSRSASESLSKLHTGGGVGGWGFTPGIQHFTAYISKASDIFFTFNYFFFLQRSYDDSD